MYYLSKKKNTVEPLYQGHFGTLIWDLITEVSSIQGSLNTLQYYTGTQNGVCIIKIPSIKRFVERFHCNHPHTLQAYQNILTIIYIHFGVLLW